MAASPLSELRDTNAQNLSVDAPHATGTLSARAGTHKGDSAETALRDPTPKETHITQRLGDAGDSDRKQARSAALAAARAPSAHARQLSPARGARPLTCRRDQRSRQKLRRKACRERSSRRLRPVVDWPEPSNAQARRSLETAASPGAAGSSWLCLFSGFGFCYPVFRVV
ncbi:hypothetical protein NN561_008764 [Cricetulus griseus]